MNICSTTHFLRAGAEADHLLASFLNDLRPQSLEAFEIFSYSDIGAETFLALNCHRGSLQELKLNNIKPEAMPSLSLMKGCVALTSLLMTETIGTTDLENRQHDVFLEVVAWLRKCRGLQSITFQKFMSAPAILTPILLEDNIHLAKLELEGYSGVASREFHLALAHQQSLRSLWLKGDGDDFVRDDFDALIGSLSKLTQLVDLRLRDISDYFRDEHICQLARSLPRLEEWWTSGFGITDAIWTDVASLRSLRRLELSAWTTFTIQGLLEFISTLKDGNRGLILSVMMADPESGLTEDEQSLVRDTLLAKAEGRFDYILARGICNLSSTSSRPAQLARSDVVSRFCRFNSRFFASELTSCKIQTYPNLRGSLTEYAVGTEFNFIYVHDVSKEHTEHELVQNMSDGTLLKDRFETYMVAHCLFLVRKYKSRG